MSLMFKSGGGSKGTDKETFFKKKSGLQHLWFQAMLNGDQYEVRVDNYGLKKAHNTKIIIIKCRKTLSDQVTVIQYEDSVSQTMPKSHLSISINILPTHLQCVYLNSEFQNILFVA